MATTTPIAICTALYGGVDRLRPQARQAIEAEWICFTDDPELEAPEPWRVVLEPRRYTDPRLAAKWRKLWPTRERSIWIDANMEVTSPSFAREAIACVHDGIALFQHPRRDCIYAEVEASLNGESQNGKYRDQPLREQVAHYRSQGHPEGGGLYACGTIAWDVRDGQAWRIGAAWLAECERWSIQDQLSFPVICRRLGISPGLFPFEQITKRRPLLGNPWLLIHPHLR